MSCSLDRLSVVILALPKFLRECLSASELPRYNAMEHRSEPHSRMEDWLANLPASGVQAVCSWERFCTFAREPERRKVGGDARVSVAGVNYKVDPDLAGETVILWWGIFDNELYVEHGDKRFGPYAPVGAGGPNRGARRTTGLASSCTGSQSPCSTAYP